jgi:hypothetical protein
MATEAVADVAHGWHGFFCCVCVLFDTQFVEFLVFLRKYPVDFFCYSTLFKWVAQKEKYHTPSATWSGRNTLPKAVI